MPKSRIMDDHEVAVARAMLAKGMPNDVVHFYFNRADRLISSGRITNIKSGAYAKGVPAATSQELQEFMDRWNAAHSVQQKGPASPTDLSVVIALFEKRKTGWFVKHGETGTVECKQNYAVDGKIIKAIAGLANADGGYILFGIKNGTNAAEGMSGDKFETLDPAVLNSHLTSTLDPVPRYQKLALDIGGKKIGVLYVEKCDAAPVIAVKSVGNVIVEGGVYYRYPGESKLIKAGELREIIKQREDRARADLARHMQRVASGAEATLDLETGKVAGRAGSFVIGEDLLPSIQFLREGDFTQAQGAPALKLIGDVQAISPETKAKVEIIRENVTPPSIIENYLRGNMVQQPLQYLHAHAYQPRKWMPIWHYANQLKLTPDELIADLQRLDACMPSTRDAMVKRLKGELSAFKAQTGKPARMLADMVAGKIVIPAAAGDFSAFSYAIGALPVTFEHCAQAKTVLLESLSTADGNRMSKIARAACRLDEIEHAQRQ